MAASNVKITQSILRRNSGIDVMQWCFHGLWTMWVRNWWVESYFVLMHHWFGVIWKNDLTKWICLGYFTYTSRLLHILKVLLQSQYTIPSWKICGMNLIQLFPLHLVIVKDLKNMLIACLDRSFCNFWWDWMTIIVMLEVKSLWWIHHQLLISVMLW